MIDLIPVVFEQIANVNVEVPVDVPSSPVNAGIVFGFSENIVGLHSPPTHPYEPTIGLSIEERIPREDTPSLPMSDWDWQGIAAIGCIAGLVILNIYAVCKYEGTEIPPSL